MTVDEIRAVLDTAEAHAVHGEAVRIRQYLTGQHKVLNRKDFAFKGEVLKTSKILLQNVKSIIDFHASYLCGNAITLTGQDAVVKLFNSIYDKANYALTDYQIATDLITYGNSYEYIFKDNNGVIQSKVFDVLDSFPVYDAKGQYQAFIEYWRDFPSGDEYCVLYERDRVTEFSTASAGHMMQTGQHRNLSGLPVHYTSGIKGEYSSYGAGLVSDLIPITDEIEAILSKTSDAVSTLSLNPLGVSAGQRIDAKIDKDIVGTVLNLEDGGNFSYANATIDSATVQLLLTQLTNMFYTIAQVPSVLYNGNVSNVSEVSLKLLFAQADSRAKRTAAFLKQGFYRRWEAMRRVMKDELTDEEFDSLDANFNYNMPVDNSAVLNDLLAQHEAGALSKKSLIELSPYSANADAELEQIRKEKVEAK